MNTSSLEEKVPPGEFCEDFVDAFRLQYGVSDLQERVAQEIELRSQGPLEIRPRF